MHTPTQPLPKTLSRDELEALLAVPKNLRDQALIETMAGCGLRVSEACRLKLEQVHWSSDSPSLRFVGKGSKERIVPMNQQVQDALRTWLEARGPNHSPYVFGNLRTGERLCRKTVWFALKRYARKANIRPIYPHMLRHSFGTTLADRNVPLERIRELMGHSSIQTSQIYITVSTEQKRQAVERLDRRHRLVRWLSRQRNRSYRFFRRFASRRVSFSRGETVGRQAELRQLQDHVSRGIDTLLIGPVGVGKSHLLNLLEGEQLIRLPGLTPPRQALISIAEELHRKGVLRVSPERGETDPGCDLRTAGPSRNGEPAEPADAAVLSPEMGIDGDEAAADAAPGSTPGPDLCESRPPSGVDGAPEASVAQCRPPSSPEGAPVAPSGDRRKLSAPDSTPDPDFEAFKKQHARTSVRGWVQLVCEAVEKDAWTLVVDDLSDLSASTGRRSATCWPPRRRPTATTGRRPRRRCWTSKAAGGPHGSRPKVTR